MAAASRAGHNFPRSAAAVFGMRRDNAFPKLAVLKIYLGEDYRSSNFRLYCTLSVAGHALDSARYASLKPIASVAEASGGIPALCRSLLQVCFQSRSMR